MPTITSKPRTDDLVYRPYQPSSGEGQYGGMADAAARKYGLDPLLFRAVITQESAWNPSAVSSAGARGLTQVVPRWHPNANLSTPQTQLDYGAKHLSELVRKYGNNRDALAVYNSGKPWATSQAYGETNNYVTKILAAYKTRGGSGGNPVAKAADVATAGAASWGPSGPTQLPSIDPWSTNAIQKYATQSQRDVLAGRDPGDVTGLAQQIIKRRKAVVDTAITGIGATAFPGGDQQGVVDQIQGPGSGGAAVGAADDWLGTPYSWGGGTPSGPSKGFGRGANTVGFDCSSLVQYAWAKAGVQLPRTTYDQIKVGTAVNPGDRSKWVPGDLLFPSTGHVQMYVGGGKVIEAPRTGGRVQIVPARSSYIAVRRPR